MSHLLLSEPAVAAPRTTASTWAVIPARGGSKGIPGKNLAEVGGIPLVVRAIASARAADGVDRVAVSTDDPQIADVATRAGARVIVRPADLSGDAASSESALLHALEVLEAEGVAPDVTVFVQATSPFIDPSDLSRAVALVRDGDADVALSVAPSHVHLWTTGEDGLVGVNHDPATRQRRQDRPVEYAETGAFYVMRTDGLREHGHRFFGRVAPVVVSAQDALEIDDPHDLEAARSGAVLRGERAPIRAKVVVTDFDGVHTDDAVWVDETGRESVRVSRSDGMGVGLLRRAGVPVLVLSTERNPVVAARASKLGVEVIQGSDDKRAALIAWAELHDVDLTEVAYLGNDVNDVGCLQSVGWPVVVADAHPAATAAARIVLSRRGGDAAVRELADRVLAHHPTEGKQS